MQTEAFERALYDTLRTHSVLQPIVGDRVFVGRVPQQSQLPAIVIRRIALLAEYSLANELTERQAVYEIASLCSGDSGPGQAKAMDDAVQDRLSGFSGNLGVSPNTIAVHGSTIEGGNYLFEDPTDATDAGTHNYSTDFRFTYTQPAPAH